MSKIRYRIYTCQMNGILLKDIKRKREEMIKFLNENYPYESKIVIDRKNLQFLFVHEIN
jgi:hypothetical protein